MAARFVEFLPVFPNACLYVAELSNGTVKIGRTRTPRVRLLSLAYECRKRMSAEVLQVFVSCPISYVPSRVAERKAIAALRSAGAPIAHRIEYFSGLDFGAAVALVQPIAETHAGHPWERPFARLTPSTPISHPARAAEGYSRPGVDLAPGP